MIKLRDAKCPNCGANIQVNDQLENTICQYCGSQVIIEEAIEKYKLEISGKVEVEGIKGRTSKLSQARKHMAIEEYAEAKNILMELINEDQFDVEAYIELIKIDIETMKKRDFDEKSSEQTDYESWRIIKEIVSYYDRIKKIDDNNIVDNGLRDYMDNINYYKNLISKTEEEDKILNELVGRLNDYLFKTRNISSECEKAYYSLIDDAFKVRGAGLCTYASPDAKAYDNGADTYRISKFTKIERDGTLVGNYDNITKRTVFNKYHLSLIHQPDEKPNSVEEIKQNFESFASISEQYIEKCSEHRNKEIDKENKKIDAGNTISDIKNKFKYILIGLLGLWTLFMVVWTLSFIFKGEIGGAIAIIIFLDSWLVTLPVLKIKDLLLDIKLEKQSMEFNKNNKKKHV